MPAAALFWVWFCAYLNFAGWTLSALHQLSAAGYSVALLIGFAALFIWRKKNSKQFFPQVRCQKLRRRFRKPFPLAFLILAAMAFLGGVLHPPSNYDGLAYRVPRVLHWLAAGQWQWIYTGFERVNVRSCGIEWVSAPFIALLKTDRLLFLVNIASLLLLPGLMFSVFTRLGVCRRTAWHWMWIAPTGYCYLLQAGSIGNDLFGATFVLAAMDFALRAKISRAPRDFFTSVLAAAMMTGCKLSDLPLMLPWAIAIFPSLSLAKRNLARTMIIFSTALIVSAAPTMFFNWQHCGDWSGLALESPGDKKMPVFQAGAGATLTVMQNLAPPVLPDSARWGRDIEKILPAGFKERLAQTDGSYDAKAWLSDLQVEEGAGLGLGVSILLLASFFAARFQSCRSSVNGTPWSGDSIWQTGVRLSPWISLFAVFARATTTEPISRLITPYYALLLPALLMGLGHERLVKKCWWRATAFAGFVMAAGLLVVSPARPLFPVGIFLQKVHSAAAQHPSLSRVEAVYSIYHSRNDAFAPVRDVLPPDVKILGLVTFDDPETSLWRPFGSRRIEHVRAADLPTDLKQRGIQYVLVKPGLLGKEADDALDAWLKKMNAKVVGKIPLTLRVSEGALDWYLVKLN
jgi:hypothetical protein